MNPRRTVALNYAAYQIGWLAAVGGAALGWGTAGAAVAAVLTAAHVALARDRLAEVALVAVSLATGAVVESWQIGEGTYRLLEGAPARGLPPAWLLVLWAQFATTFRFCLRDVLRRPWAAVLLGALGGPVAFLAGERLGAVVLWAPVAPGLLRLVAAWAMALAWLSLVTRVVDARRAAPAYRV